MTMTQLRRVRSGVRAVLALGVAASVTANILHAKPNPVAQTIAAWSPLALLLTIELISRVPIHGRSLASVRVAATATIAAIAAWVSYWHMAGVAARYGETGAAPYLLPLSVDGVVVVASVCLVELAGRIRATAAVEPDTDRAVSPDNAQVSAPVDPTPQPAGEHDTAPVIARTVKRPAPGARPAIDTAAQVAKLRAQRPDITQAEVAKQVKKSERTVARHWADTAPDTQPANGHAMPNLIETGDPS